LGTNVNLLWMSVLSAPGQKSIAAAGEGADYGASDNLLQNQRYSEYHSEIRNSANESASIIEIRGMEVASFLFEEICLSTFLLV